MKFISFSPNKLYFYFLIYWILDLIINLGKNYCEENKSISAEAMDLINLLCLNIGDLLAGFLVLFTHLKMKHLNERKEKPNVSKKNTELIYKDYSIKDKKYRIIFVMSLLELIGPSDNFLYDIIIMDDHEKLIISETIWLISIGVISRIIFSNIILKTKIYNHHIFSVILFVFGFLPIFIHTIINQNTINYWKHISFLFPRNIIFAFTDTLLKILLMNKFILPHYLMFYKGLFNLGMYIIILPILFSVHQFNFDFIYSLDNISLWIINIIIIILFSLLRGLCIMKIIYTFSPLHVIFVEVAYTLFLYLTFIITTQKEYNLLDIIMYIIYIISLIIIIFGTLVFNEIIILNFCRLNHNTKYYILKRAKKDAMTEKILNINSTSEHYEEKNENDNEKEPTLY